MLSFREENVPSTTNEKETTVPVETNLSKDSVSIRGLMATIIVGTSLQGLVASWVTAPVVSAVIIFIVLVFAARVAKFSIEFRRNKPNEIKRSSTLGLSWIALVFCVALVLWSLYQSFANPTLLGIITLISGIVLCYAPAAVLRFNVRN